MKNNELDFKTEEQTAKTSEDALKFGGGGTIIPLLNIKKEN